jgi:polygalacturonase
MRGVRIRRPPESGVAQFHAVQRTGMVSSRLEMASPFDRGRRAFLRAGGAAALGVAATRLYARSQSAPSEDLWAEADRILRRIVAPRFPSREFDLRRYGARDDGSGDSTAAFRNAIQACADAGGGRVMVPAGRFLTGPIVLRSNVELHVAQGATILFSRDANQYLPLVLTRYEGVELMNYSPFIYALDQANIAITGSGTLDGQADEAHWWSWRNRAVAPSGARARLMGMGERNVPVAERVFGAGSDMRPVFIQPYRCRGVLIDGVTIVNSPMWEINPVLCENVTVRGVSVHSHGPNNDGCDPESCRDVLIERCTFDTGDDCIALKSGRNADGRRLHAPIENVVIRDCVMQDGHGGVVIGSEISGGARNIFAERCRMDSPRLDRVLRFKNNAERGGLIERIAMRQITVGQVAEAIIAADFYYEEGDTGSFTPILRTVDVRDVTSRKSKYAFMIKGYARAPISDIRVTDCSFDGVEQPDVIEGMRDLVLTNVRVNGQVRTARITK